MTATPGWGDVLPLKQEDWQKLPDVVTPYYIEAKDGFFLHRRLPNLGRGLAPVRTKPASFKPTGHPNGYFVFDGEPLPTTITAQMVSFFRRIFEKHKTEAEVIITQHQETKAYRLYVPTQRVQGGGVHSIYDPTTIDPAYLVVGTAHSHCDFSPFHSSTDEADADGMDGLHLTIGFLTKDEPGVAAMIAMNGTLYHFKDISIVADFSDLEAAAAPDWWDRYVWTGNVTDAMRPKWAIDKDWERFMGRTPQKPHRYFHQPTTQPYPARTVPTGKPSQPYTMPSHYRNSGPSESSRNMLASFGYYYDANSRSYRPLPSEHAMLAESNERNAERLREYLRDADDDVVDIISERDPDQLVYEDYWEDQLGKDFVESLYNSGLMTDDDVDAAVEDFPQSAEPEYWIRRFKIKLLRAAIFLRRNGTDLTVNMPKTPSAVVTTQEGNIQ